jgi:hypothetical protein
LFTGDTKDLATPPSPGCRPLPDPAADPSGPDHQDSWKEASIMRRRPLVRKAVKTAIIAKAARRLGCHAEKHLSRRR